MRERRTSVPARDRRDRQDHGPDACGGPACGPAAGPCAGRILYESRKLKKRKRKEEKKNKRASGCSTWARAPGPPVRGARQGAPHSCRDHGPYGPDGPGVSRILLRSLPTLPRFGAAAHHGSALSGFCRGFQLNRRQQVIVTACASECFDRNNCVRFLVVFSFWF
jgi:hypothetical protein